MATQVDIEFHGCGHTYSVPMPLMNQIDALHVLEHPECATPTTDQEAPRG